MASLAGDRHRLYFPSDPGIGGYGTPSDSRGQRLPRGSGRISHVAGYGSLYEMELGDFPCRQGNKEKKQPPDDHDTFPDVLPRYNAEVSG